MVAQAAAILAAHLVVDYDFAFAVLDDEPAAELVALAEIAVRVDELAAGPDGPAGFVELAVPVVLAAVPEDAAVAPGRAPEPVAVVIVVDGFGEADDFVDAVFDQTVIVEDFVPVAAENLVARDADFEHVDQRGLVLPSVE